VTGFPLWERLLQLVLACILCGLIGWERERHDRPAGLRTHILVGVGAALISMVSQAYFGPGIDASRIAAQIVSGIGFLGAGTIIRQGSAIRGLTTAASLWTVAGIGMAVARGGMLYSVAVAATALVFVVLTVLDRLEHMLVSKHLYRRLNVAFAGERDREQELLSALRGMGVQMRAIERTARLMEGERQLSLDLRIPAGMTTTVLEDRLLGLDWVRAVSWE